MIQVTAIDHIVLRVVDVDAMIAFYVGVLGCVVERRQDELGLVQLRAGAALIDLVTVNGSLGRAGGAPPDVGGRNLDHFCMRVNSFDAVAVATQLDATGISHSPIEPRYGSTGFGPSIYISDPEGNTVELRG
jgi:catechol 2,3-dioxygenase-like lactoylglutathione lyase family enzyme